MSNIISFLTMSSFSLIIVFSVIIWEEKEEKDRKKWDQKHKTEFNPKMMNMLRKENILS